MALTVVSYKDRQQNKAICGISPDFMKILGNVGTK
jgi:hypothetical protein